MASEKIREEKEKTGRKIKKQQQKGNNNITPDDIGKQIKKILNQ